MGGRIKNFIYILNLKIEKVKLKFSCFEYKCAYYTNR